jgi:uncharacterized protein
MGACAFLYCPLNFSLIFGYDTITVTIQRSVPEVLSYPAAFISYLTHFHGDRDYFECHEVLEEYWKEETTQERDSHWVGLIQIAVSLYHYRRNNFKGAYRTMNKAITILRSKKAEIVSLGLRYPEMLELLEETAEKMNKQVPYKSVNLPISDNQLAAECKRYCQKNGLIWCGNSNLDDASLIHRHKMRDRTDIILERQHQLAARKKE